MQAERTHIHTYTPLMNTHTRTYMHTHIHTHTHTNTTICKLGDQEEVGVQGVEGLGFRV